MMTLTEFQNDFAAALLAPAAKAGTSRLQSVTRQPGFAVYRNTVMKGCVDALRANYPTVARLTGDIWFGEAAVTYARATLPGGASLLNYGDTFASFLDTFEPAADLPYLGGIARLDRMWIEAHCAIDEPPLDPAALACLAPDVIGLTKIYPHAAARWRWFADAPVFSIWSQTRYETLNDAEVVQPSAEAVSALLTRPHDTVEWIALDAPCFAFIDACAAGETIERAVSAALSADPAVDLQQMMAHLLQAGAFGRMHPA